MISIGLPLTIKVVVDYVKVPYDHRDIEFGLILLFSISFLKIA